FEELECEDGAMRFFEAVSLFLPSSPASTVTLLVNAAAHCRGNTERLGGADRNEGLRRTRQRCLGPVRIVGVGLSIKGCEIPRRDLASRTNGSRLVDPEGDRCRDGSAPGRTRVRVEVADSAIKDQRAEAA